VAVSLITLGGAHYGARKRKWGPPRTSSMLAFYQEMFDCRPARRRRRRSRVWISASQHRIGWPAHCGQFTIFGLTLLWRAGAMPELSRLVLAA
jgi:hypothetical protein